jgi:hypothetical protein
MSPREWSRIHDETDAAYATFQEWLHSVDGNGLRPDVYEWAKEKDRDTSAILRWAMDDYWLTRAEAFDEWVGKRNVVKTFPFYSPLALLMRKIVKVELEKISAAQDLSGPAPGIVDARMIRGWAMEVRKAEEFAVKSEAAFSPTLVPGQAIYDFTKLDIAELRVLEALHEKAKV